MFYQTYTARKSPKSLPWQRQNGAVRCCVTSFAASMFNSVTAGGDGSAQWVFRPSWPQPLIVTYKLVCTRDQSLLFNKSFFLIFNTCLSHENIARQCCALMPRWWIFGDFLGPAFPVSRMQHISDLISKFALGPHHVYGRHPICVRWD